MRRIYFILAAIVLVLTSCNDKKANTTSNEEGAAANVEQATEDNEQKAEAVTLDGVSQLLNWSFGVMKVSGGDGEFVVSEVNGELEWKLKANGDGTYQETSGKKDMIGQSATFKVQKVDGVTTLSAYNGEMLMAALVSGDDLKAFRDRGYKRILTSNFEPVEGEEVEISDKEMKVFLLPEAPTMGYFFIEDGKGDLTDNIRLSGGRFFLNFSPADKGVNLHFCHLNLDTDELEVQYGSENTTCLRYAEDPGWEWLSTDVLDSDFLIYNFEKPYWKLMLNKLKEKKQPNEVEQWNLALLENLIAHNEPYTGMESSE
ncbi:MAG: hypothetical protein IKW98_04345 [Prevotella sp.]|nr:hypothetical protein [Prevotella sp.]